jgi:CDP-paratose 2-epimerase
MMYLVTGGCGFVGSNIACEVLKRGGELAVFDNLYRTGSEKNLKWLRGQGGFSFIKEDIRDKAAVDAAVAKCRPDVVFHLAGQVAMTTSISDPRLDFEVNALGTFNLLEALRKHAPETPVVYSSTNKVYGDLEWAKYAQTKTRYVPVDYPKGFPEDIPLDFHSPYGCSKGAADQYMLDYHRIFGLNTVVFRHSSMYGGRQYSTYDQGWIGWFCQKALEAKRGIKEPFTISGNGKQVRDVLYADDMVKVYFKAVEKIKKTRGQAFNIGGGMGNSLSLLELFALLEEELDVSLKYRRLPPRESDQKVFVADIGKCKRLTGWSPSVDKRKGVRKMLGWVAENG